MGLSVSDLISGGQRPCRQGVPVGRASASSQVQGSSGCPWVGLLGLGNWGGSMVLHWIFGRDRVGRGCPWDVRPWGHGATGPRKHADRGCVTHMATQARLRACQRSSCTRCGLQGTKLSKKMFERALCGCAAASWEGWGCVAAGCPGGCASGYALGCASGRLPSSTPTPPPLLAPPQEGSHPSRLPPPSPRWATAWRAG